MTRAIRSPGSTLKPLIYGLAFEAGIAHPSSLIEDRPTAFSGYVPANFDRSYQGTVTVRKALALSLNIPAVQLLDAVGPARLVARMRRAGANPVLADASPPGLAVGLGGVGVTLMDLVRIYGAIARGGEVLDLRRDPGPGVSRGPTASPIGAPKTAVGTLPRRVLEARAAWYLGSILRDVPAPSNAASASLAFKTGTSYGYRDAWAIGFDGRHVAGSGSGDRTGHRSRGWSASTPRPPSWSMSSPDWAARSHRPRPRPGRWSRRPPSFPRPSGKPGCAGPAPALPPPQAPRSPFRPTVPAWRSASARAAPWRSRSATGRRPSPGWRTGRSSARSLTRGP